MEQLTQVNSLIAQANLPIGWGGGGGGAHDLGGLVVRVVCLSHPCTFRHSSVFGGEGRQIRHAELGKQPEF